MRGQFLIVILAYLSLLIELVFLHVPSVASSQNLWQSDGTYSQELSQANINTAKWSLGKKVVLLALPVVIIVGTFLYPLLRIVGLFGGDIDLWTMSRLVGIFALLIIFLGRWITLTSVMTIRLRNSQKNDEFTLHEDSLFGRSRNPIQVGMYLFGLGLILLFPNPAFILGFAFYILYMHYKIQVEEGFLQLKFGELYSAYKQKTKRYL